ncbi:DnaA N-terminal domain-containing protein [Litorisediminicola beolgyonensis]|uniref:DnaA N-terminal domain-containing protein n=1 Tax=Litorisediminicola beolgyonensis TaxID=1173614 RepID=A0ABW3ZJP5_9RHOB
MAVTHPVGRNASARKYDILTALGASALASDKTRRTLILRFLTLITARYNWRSADLCVGRAEMARLWCVDERTVKREMAKLKAMGWLTVKRPGARGRITSYRLDLDRILSDTRAAWTNVGEDFVARLTLETEPAAGQGAVVAFPGSKTVPAPDLGDGDEWSLAAAVLHTEDIQSYGAWIRPLTRQGRRGDLLLLMAPSRFHAHYVQTHLLDRITRAVRRIDDGLDRVAILFPGATL